MSDFVPLIPISLQIRKIIFEKFNDVDTKFTNDDIFEILKSENDVLSELGLEHLQAVRIKCALLSLKVLKSALYTYLGSHLDDKTGVDTLKTEAENLY